jgi:adenylylsulfate kinase-like enzyme|tara:strand:+ start:7804 stop:8331 length:528 start_codon:yes stop_codon:yes gene_type:complete
MSILKKIKINKESGVLIWITGLSGSGKTSLAHEIHKFVEGKIGPTVVISGDSLREIFNYKKFDKKSRLKYAMTYASFCRKITSKKLNIIFATVSLFHKVRLWNKNNIKNYLEIYIESNIEKLIKKKKKFFYKTRLKNIVGKNIKAEFPKKSHIIIKNNFDKSIPSLKKELIKKLN